MAGISHGNTQERKNSLLPPTKSQNNYPEHKTAAITTHCKTDTTKERTACYSLLLPKDNLFSRTD